MSTGLVVVCEADPTRGRQSDIEDVKRTLKWCFFGFVAKRKDGLITKRNALQIHYYEARKRFLYCLWGALGERERYRERERERERRKWGHLSSAEIGDEFCTFPCLCTLVSPLFNSVEFTLCVAKNVVLFETVSILRTVNWCVTGDRNSTANDRISGCTVLLLVENIEKSESN